MVFSAHGVPKAVPADATARNMFFLDATCPLVSKVHIEANRHFDEGREIVLIGHAGHVEVIGTMGQLPAGAITLIETVADAEAFTPRDPRQSRLRDADDAERRRHGAIVETLQRRFPAIALPHKEDICYATTNRQEAVKSVAPEVDAMIVVGAPETSNSVRLVEVAQRAGCTRAMLVERAEQDRLGTVRGHRAARHHCRRLGAGGAGRRSDRGVRAALRHQGRGERGAARDASSSTCPANCGLPPPHERPRH